MTLTATVFYEFRSLHDIEPSWEPAVASLAQALAVNVLPACGATG